MNLGGEPLTINVKLTIQFVAGDDSGFVSNPAAAGSQPEDVEPSKETESDIFCRITPHAFDTGHAQEVEDELRSACVSAPKLIKAIRRNEALGYLDTQNLSSTELYDLLNEHFGLTFGRDNFRRYRSK